MEELNISELREVAEKANAVWETDYLVGGPVDTFYDTFKASVVLALLSSAEAREEAQARVADWTERLQAICEQASCPPGLNRFDFIANRLAALQSAEARAREAEARVERTIRAADAILARVTMVAGRYLYDAPSENLVPVLAEEGVELTAMMFRELYNATSRDGSEIR